MVQVHWRRYRIASFVSLMILLILFGTHKMFQKFKSISRPIKDITNHNHEQARSLPNQFLEKGQHYIGNNKLSHGIEIRNDINKTKDFEHLRASEYVHAFYYAWYGSPAFDGKFYHWNHRFLPHWDSRISKAYSTNERHNPPDDIGSNFYPKLGPYSSFDTSVLHKHMQYCVMAGIGVLALSWYPNGNADDEGKPADKLVPKLLDVANKYGIKICFHIEPYKGRTAKTVADDIKFLIENYQSHPAFYTTTRKNGDLKSLPFVYVYDSYLIPSSEWSVVLKSEEGIRGTSFDAIVIGLFVKKGDLKEIIDAGFDGFYTYFASSGFSYGSDVKHWRELALGHQLLFVPSVGPGYVDTNVRPWNSKNTKKREDGHYYDNYWSKALLCQSRFISITSFNEWHEGTQIEPAETGVSVRVEHLNGRKQPGIFTYDDYGKNPNLYLQLTRKWVETFSLLVK